MKITEKRWHGCRYHVVNTGDGWSIQKHEWCKEVFGKNSFPWDLEAGRWYAQGHEFWFKDESDMTIFILRWT